jgi:hypothetical protein
MCHGARRANYEYSEANFRTKYAYIKYFKHKFSRRLQ